MGVGSSATYKPDVLAAALTVAIIAVVLIVGLLLCRSGARCACCCCCCAGKGVAADGDDRPVIYVVGTEPVAVRPIPASAIAVNTVGGGFVLYAGAERGVAV